MFEVRALTITKREPCARGNGKQMPSYAFQFAPGDCYGSGFRRRCERRGSLGEPRATCLAQPDGTYTCSRFESELYPNHVTTHGCVAPLLTRIPGCGPTEFWCPEPTWDAAPTPFPLCAPSCNALAPPDLVWNWSSVSPQG